MVEKNEGDDTEEEEEEEERRRSGEDRSFYGCLHLIHRQELMINRWSLLNRERALTSCLGTLKERPFLSRLHLSLRALGYGIYRQDAKYAGAIEDPSVDSTDDGTYRPSDSYWEKLCRRRYPPDQAARTLLRRPQSYQHLSGNLNGLVPMIVPNTYGLSMSRRH